MQNNTPLCTFAYYYLIYQITAWKFKFFYALQVLLPTTVNTFPVLLRVPVFFTSFVHIDISNCLRSHCLVDSAVHCFVSSGPVELPVEHIRVTVGEHDLSNRETPLAREVRVRRLVLYPGYVCERFNHDIALLELDEVVGWSESVWPACLPQGSFLSPLLLSHPDTLAIYRGADTSLARPASRSILFNSETTSFDSCYIYYIKYIERVGPGVA